MLPVAFKIVLRMGLTLLSIVGFFLQPFLILYGQICTPQRKLPPFSDTLLEIPAVDLAEKILNREVGWFIIMLRNTAKQLESLKMLIFQVFTLDLCVSMVIFHTKKDKIKIF